MVRKCQKWWKNIINGSEQDEAKLAKLQAQGRVGGKGTPRRKVVKKATTSGVGDDKKLQSALKKLPTQPITGIEEVNMMQADGKVLHFSAPKGMHKPSHWRLTSNLNQCPVHAAVQANTFAVYGAGQQKELTELVPGILNQLGQDSLSSLRKLAESYSSMGGNGVGGEDARDPSDDDDIPVRGVDL